jgi:hypothetical protein
MVWVIKVDFTNNTTYSVNIRASYRFVGEFLLKSHRLDIFCNRGFQPTELSPPPAKSAVGTIHIMPAHRLVTICAEPMVLICSLCYYPTG